ncbi:IS3 family transposase [Streptomyces sp. NPDC001820]|uniref:IS3 family transposase n=1 Tax=Streptomyces sp. NPDC001820 TaxID=3364613 RepID=UPI00367A7163
MLRVSRAAFYARHTATPGPRAVRDAELTQQITAVHTRSRGTYGAPRVHAPLKHDGAICGRRRVARLMRAAGLAGRQRRRRHPTTVPDPRAATRPDLIVRDFRPDPTGLDARWCGDITYIPTGEGWLYLATVIDIASRRVIGWATADHMRTDPFTVLNVSPMSSARRSRVSLTVHSGSIATTPPRGRIGSISRARSPIMNCPRDCCSTTSRSSATICSYRCWETLPANDRLVTEVELRMRSPCGYCVGSPRGDFLRWVRDWHVGQGPKPSGPSPVSCEDLQALSGSTLPQ